MIDLERVRHLAFEFLDADTFSFKVAANTVFSLCNELENVRLALGNANNLLEEAHHQLTMEEMHHTNKARKDELFELINKISETDEYPESVPRAIPIDWKQVWAVEAIATFLRTAASYPRSCGA